MAAAEDKLIEDGSLDFSQRLHAELPLRHFGEFHDQEQLTEVVKVQKNHVFRKVFDKIWPREKEEIASLFKKLNRRMDKVVAEWAKKNREHEVQSVSFLQKWVDPLCENFKEALEYQLLLNPDMEVESLKNYISSKTQNVTNVFESIWKPGNSQMQEERKSKLKKHLKAKEEDILEKQKHNLEIKSADEGKKLLGEVGTVLLERSRQLKSCVDKHQRLVSKSILKGLVVEMLEYLLNGKGSSLRETHEEIYGKLVETMEGEVKFLSEEPEEKITAEEVVSYVKRFDEKLRSYCFDTESGMDGAQEIQEQDPLRQIALQEILNEFEEERPSEPNDEACGEANENHGGIQVDEDEVLHMEDGESTSAAPTKRTSRRRRKFTEGGDSIMTCDNSSNEVPPSRKAAAAEKTHRESSRLKKSRKSVQAASSGGNRKKMSRNLDPSMTSANHDKDKDILHPISDDDGVQIQNGSVSPETASPEQSSKRTQDKRKANDEVEDSPPKRKKTRKDSCKTTKSVGDKCPCPIRRSARSRTPTDTARALRVNSRKRRETFVVKMKTKKTKDNDEFQTKDCEANCDDGELSSPDPVQPSSRKTSGKKLKCRRQMVMPACPGKITFLQGNIPRYECNVCKRKFRCKNSYLLKYHGDFCNEKNWPHICTECGKGFIRKQHLTVHSLTHSEEKPLKCPECPMAFKQSSHLARHIRNHSGEKPYQCTECPNSFSQLSTLKYHVRAHDRGTSYSCGVCNLSFVSSRALHTHNLTHEGKLPLVCNYCQQRFSKLDQLKRHVVVHSGERPFQCPTCAVSHTSKFNLASHLESIHGHPRQVALKLASDAALEYLLRETGNQSCRDIPHVKISSVVVNHVIKKANLQLPDDITVASAKCKGRNE